VAQHALVPRTASWEPRGQDMNSIRKNATAVDLVIDIL
jgi:hypothetical protein